MIDRPYPQRRKNVFKSENTSKQKSEDRGKNTCRRNNPRKRRFLKLIDQSSADHQKQSLPDISEHHSKDK